MSWFVYIAQARTRRYYVGISKNVSKRITDHNTHSGSRFAKQQGPFSLVYQSAPMKSKMTARLREMQIKRWSRKKKERLINGEWE